MKQIDNGKLIFLIFLILHLFPLFSVDILLTLDGSSHLYNAKLFNEILAGNETVSEFYKINTELVPNYLGHLILSGLLWLTTPILALKILHLIYILGLSISFRKLVLELNPKNGIMSILIFPLIYSMPFMVGFYNFSLALVLLLTTLYYWFKNKGNKDLMFYIKLSILFLLTYLAHSFTFGVLCLSLAVIIISELGFKNYKNWTTEGLKVFASALFPLALGIYFVTTRTSVYRYLSSEKLWEQIYNLEFIYSFDQSNSVWVLFYLFFGIVAVSFFKQKKELPLLLISIILLLFYFILPDGIGYASVFSIRTLLLSFLFLTLWLSLQKINKIFRLILIIGLFIYQNNRINQIQEWSIPKNNKAKEMLKVAELFPPNSIIKPIRKLAVWDYLHLSNLLGISKPQIILENYEATHDYFPIEWEINLEKEIKQNCTFQTTINNKVYNVDYLVAFGNGQTDIACEKQQIEYAEKHFKKLYHSNFITVYKVVH